MTVTEHVSERQAREVAEQARETQWRQPSFAKELFLGRLRLDLVRRRLRSEVRRSWPNCGISANHRSMPR